MAIYNVEMNYLNSNGNYDTLMPKTILNNISDWSSMLYSKEEIDNIIEDNELLISDIGSFYIYPTVDSIQTIPLLKPLNKTKFFILWTGLVQHTAGEGVSGNIYISFGKNRNFPIGTIELSQLRGAVIFGVIKDEKWYNYFLSVSYIGQANNGQSDLGKQSYINNLFEENDGNLYISWYGSATSTRYPINIGGITYIQI